MGSSWPRRWKPSSNDGRLVATTFTHPPLPTTHLSPPQSGSVFHHVVVYVVEGGSIAATLDFGPEDGSDVTMQVRWLWLWVSCAGYGSGPHALVAALGLMRWLYLWASCAGYGFDGHPTTTPTHILPHSFLSQRPH